MTVDALHDPAEEAPERTVVDGVHVVGSLSPSRAADFMTCPLLYRFRSIDRLPQVPTAAATRGTVVHSVLERLFDREPTDRTLETATDLLAPVWDEVLAREPGLSEVYEPSWRQGCEALLRQYFALEDPTRLQPAQRELYVEHVLGSRLLLRGYVDRVDVAPTGEVRVVDYKTGRSPGEMFEAKALFQMKFYALVLWRTWGTVPTLLQLIYLGNGEVLRYAPDEDDLLATERKVDALWQAIASAHERRDFRARRSALCGWCDHQALCPEFGGTPPPFPEPGDAPEPVGALTAPQGSSPSAAPAPGV